MTRKNKALAAVAAIAAILIATGLVIFVMRLMRDKSRLPDAKIPDSWSEFRTSPGHEAHVGRDNVNCSDCHDYQREGFKKPDMAVCAKCHEKESTHGHKGDAQTKTDCLTCHGFAPKQEIPTCISCHVAPEGPLAAIKMHASAPCADCHQLHETPSTVAATCANCHEERADKHAEHANTRGCLDCHKGHAPAATALTSCASCHATPSGPKPANHDSCMTCHKPHDFAAGANVCVGCHGQKPTLLASSVAKHTECTSCHTPHAPMEAAKSCIGCHSGVQLDHGGRRRASVAMSLIRITLPPKRALASIATAQSQRPIPARTREGSPAIAVISPTSRSPPQSPGSARPATRVRRRWSRPMPVIKTAPHATEARPTSRRWRRRARAATQKKPRARRLDTRNA